MSLSVYLLFPPHDHEPPPTLRDGLNPHHSLQRRRFPSPREAGRPDVALCTFSPLFLLPAPSSPHCTLKVSEHDSLWQPLLARSDERPHPRTSSRAQGSLKTLTPGYLKGTVVRGHPMVWPLALSADDSKQDSVVYGAEFGVVLLVKGLRTASMQEGLDCLGLYLSVLRERTTFG